jgi:hypothetical protein
VIHGFHIVAIEITQEDAVIPRVVLGPLPPGVQHLRAGRHRSAVNRVLDPKVIDHGARVTVPGDRGHHRRSGTTAAVKLMSWLFPMLRPWPRPKKSGVAGQRRGFGREEIIQIIQSLP